MQLIDRRRKVFFSVSSKDADQRFVADRIHERNLELQFELITITTNYPFLIREKIHFYHEN